MHVIGDRNKTWLQKLAAFLSDLKSVVNVNHIRRNALVNLNLAGRISNAFVILLGTQEEWTPMVSEAQNDLHRTSAPIGLASPILFHAENLDAYS